MINLTHTHTRTSIFDNFNREIIYEIKQRTTTTKSLDNFKPKLHKSFNVNRDVI